MNIKTERLHLRPITPTDLYTTYGYAGDKDNANFMIFLPHDTLEETAEFLEEANAEWQKETPDYLEFAVLLDRKHIGAISIYFEEDKTCVELGWIIHKEYWGHGYAAEATKAIVDYAIETLKVKKIIAHCDSENTASYHLMQKLGMQLEDDTQERKNRASNKMSKELKCSLVVNRC